MSTNMRATGAVNDNYVAWALYTGPAYATPLWRNSRWITGEWNGLNMKSTADDIMFDIEWRITAIKRTLAQAREAITDERKTSARNYFVIPEFFFHCKQGPYPYLALNGEQPFEYICSTLQNALKDISLLPNETWIISIGSVLTCNEPDIDALLASPAVQERLEALNAEMRNLSAEKGRRNAADFHKGAPRIKAFSYLKPTVPLSNAESSIDGLMEQYRANPLCIVRNRGAIFYLDGGSVEYAGYEKQNESTVDLTMGKLMSDGKTCWLIPGGMITEWICGYPSISILSGDKNCSAAPLASRITIHDQVSGNSVFELGVEICLDHRLQRLRRTVGMTKANGAAQDNPPLAIQLVPSGGMQILDSSISARNGGAVFNSDGCDPILTEYDDKGTPVTDGSGVFKRITCGVYASSAQTMVSIEKPYYSHSQLCFRFGSQDLNGYDNALGSKNFNGPTYDPVTGQNPALDAYPPATRLPVTGNAVSSLFAAGAGELHLYVKNGAR